jgi:molecular chaperone GrpE
MKKPAEDLTFVDPHDAQIEALTLDLQRTRADFENFRKQTDLQKQQVANITRVATVNKLLPVIDAMALAIQHNPELEPVAKTLSKTMSDLGIERIDAKPGTVFNPELHDAVQMDEDAEGETEVVSEELRPGYTLDGEVLRAAMIKASRK